MSSNPDVLIVFTASQSWFGKAIRWFTGATVSHVFVEFPVWGRRVAGEATVGGTRMVLAEKSRHNIIAEYQCRFETQPGLLAIAEALGTEYDYGGILIMVWFRMLTNWFKVKASKLSWPTKALKCSELIFVFLRSCNVLSAKSDNLKEGMTPKDLLFLCQQQPILFFNRRGEITKKIYFDQAGK